MKRLASITLVAIFATFALTSCKKDYTCTCTTTDSSGYFQPITSTVHINNAKKKDATSACNAGTVTVGTLSTSCTLN